MNLTLAKTVDRYAGMAICRVLAWLRALRELFAAQGDLPEPATLLLVKFWGLGNIVLLLPVVRSLRKRFPDARIVFLTLARNRDLLEQCDDVDVRLYVRDESALALLVSLLSAIRAARTERPDLCVDFEQFARASVIFAELSGAQQIVGLDTPGQRGRALLHHKSVRYDDTQHMGQTYLDLARAAGVPQRTYRPLAPRVTPPGVAQVEALFAAARDAEHGTDRDRVERVVVAGSRSRPLVVVHPGSGDNFQGRRWPAASFSQLADRLIEREGARVVVTGTSAEADLTARIVAGMRHGDEVIDAAGALDVAGLVALLAQSTLLVTNDTAPVHIGSSLGIPVFAFFGPNTPRLYGPLSSGSHAFYRALPCSPCLTNLNYKTSPCRMPVCIRDITVDEVAVRIRAHLVERTAGVLRDGERRDPSRRGRRSGTA